MPQCRAERLASAVKLQYSASLFRPRLPGPGRRTGRRTRRRRKARLALALASTPVVAHGSIEKID
jgi:hypothetical protein